MHENTVKVKHNVNSICEQGTKNVSMINQKLMKLPRSEGK